MPIQSNTQLSTISIRAGLNCQFVVAFYRYVFDFLKTITDWILNVETANGWPWFSYTNNLYFIFLPSNLFYLLVTYYYFSGFALLFFSHSRIFFSGRVHRLSLTLLTHAVLYYLHFSYRKLSPPPLHSCVPLQSCWVKRLSDDPTSMAESLQCIISACLFACGWPSVTAALGLNTTNSVWWNKWAFFNESFWLLVPFFYLPLKRSTALRLFGWCQRQVFGVGVDDVFPFEIRYMLPPVTHLHLFEWYV